MGQYVQNPDGTHSQQTVLTGRMALRPYKRMVLTMQGQSVAAGANLSQILDLSGYDRAIFGAVFSTALTGTMTIANQIGSLWTTPTTANLSAATSGQTPNTFNPIAEKQIAYISNTGASAVTITTAEVIAQ